MSNKKRLPHYDISHIYTNGYQPICTPQNYQPEGGKKQSYQPTKSISTQPPNKGSNVQPAKNGKIKNE